MTDQNTERFDPPGQHRGHDADLLTRFTYHPPDEPLLPETYRLVRDAGLFLALLVEATTPPSREASLALTNIEQAVMWANAGIARRGLAGTAEQGADRLADYVWARVDAAREEHGHHLYGTMNTRVATEHAPVDSAAAVQTPLGEPWPPDHHLHPRVPPLPAGHDVECLRSGLRVLTTGHHLVGSDHHVGDCPGCIAQRVLNGEPVDQSWVERETKEPEPLMIRLTDPPEVINPQVLGGRGVLMLPPEVSFVPFMADTDEAPAADDPWANPAVGETMLGIRARLRELTRMVNRFMAGLPGEG